MPKRLLILLALSSLISSCGISRNLSQMQDYGKLSTGEGVTLYHLENKSGAYMDVINYGCRIVKICVPDRTGYIDDVIVGYGDIKSFESGKERFFGATLGRYANRIKGATFTLDGKTVNLTANETLNGVPGHLHGGTKGFDRCIWAGEPLRARGKVGVRLSRVSKDGEEGYPGNLNCTVTYWWTENDECIIEYGAATDKATIINMSNHSYFNLKGSKGGYVLDHVLQVNSGKYAQNSLQYVPDGDFKDVEGTPFDFKQPHRIDYAIDIPNEQIKTMRGFSVCWKLDGWDGKIRKSADVYEPVSGRGVEVWTTEPGLLIYTGRGFNGERGKYGPIEQYGGMILETLHFPDSPNRPDFPSVILRPGQRYYSSTKFRFYAK
jgi:aldose 1-epimerase